jgi:uncharacterized protein (TIGR02996 family)
MTEEEEDECAAKELYQASVARGRDIERAEHMAGIIAHPDDLTRRLVFADWLEENGSETWAHFIRQSIEDRHPHTFGEGMPAILHLPAYNKRWQIDKIDNPSPYATIDQIHFADAHPFLTWTVRNGFVEGVALTSALWARIGDKLVATHPLQAVILTTPVKGRWDVEMGDTLAENGRFYYAGCSRSVTEVEVRLQRERDGEDLGKLGFMDAIHRLPHILRTLWPSIPLWSLQNGIEVGRPFDDNEDIERRSILRFTPNIDEPLLPRSMFPYPRPRRG